MRSRNSLHSSQHEPGGPRPRPLSVRAALRSRRAFTILEVIIAAVVLMGTTVAAYAVMLHSYRTITMARYRDNARAVLSSFTDQFSRLQTADDPGDGTGSVIRPMFQVSLNTPFEPTGFGLSWTDLAGNIKTGAEGDLNLPVTLGDTDSQPVQATITRQVAYLNMSTGVMQATAPDSAAGWVLQGVFTIHYTVAGYPQTQQLTVARSVR